MVTGYKKALLRLSGVLLLITCPLALQAENKLLFANSEYFYDGGKDLKVSETLSLRSNTEVKDYWFTRPFYLFSPLSLPPGGWWSGRPKFPKIPDFSIHVKSISLNGKLLKWTFPSFDAVARVNVKNSQSPLPMGNHLFHLEYVIENGVKKSEFVSKFHAFSSGNLGLATESSLIALRFPSFVKKESIHTEAGIINYEYFSFEPSRDVLFENSIDPANKQQIFTYQFPNPLKISEALAVKVELKKEF